MKIIAKSNFDEETVNDFLVCENINKTHGEMAVKLFNQELCGEYGTYCYALKEDDYPLYHYDP